MNEVRFIQKIGQVSMSELVKTAAQQGYVLAGSPTMISGNPAQLMVHVGVESANPEYMMVEKTGQLFIEPQIAKMLSEGWHMYGSMLSGVVPMQAMIRGDIGVHKMFGMDGSGPSEDTDWSDAIAQARKDAVADAKAYTDTQVTPLWEYVDTKHDEGMSAMRGEVAGCNSYTDTEVERIDAAYTVAISLQVKKNAEQDMALDTLDKRAKDTERLLDETIKQIDVDKGVMQDFVYDVANMRSAEQDEVNIALKKDIEAINERLDQMTRIMSHLVDQPAS